MSVTGAAAREGRFSRLIMPFELRSGKVFRNFKRKQHFLKGDFRMFVVKVLRFQECATLSIFSHSETESYAAWFDFTELYCP